MNKILIILGGEGADLVCGGVLPLRTISLVVAILYYNHQATLEKISPLKHL